MKFNLSPQRRVKLSRKASKLVGKVKDPDELPYLVNCVVQQAEIIRNAASLQADLEAEAETPFSRRLRVVSDNPVGNPQ